jgi:peptidoglycan/xylan/chitin deacetylase (PgdA/CDA1 family)
MKLTTTLFTALVGVANVHAHNAAAHHAHARRQGLAEAAAGTSSTSSTVATASGTSTSVVGIANSASAGGAVASGTTSTAAGAAGTVVGGAAAAATTTSGITAVPTHLTTTLGTTGTDIRPLSEISLGMPSQSGLPVTATYTGGQPAKISGAPNLPPTFKVDLSQWPTPDKIPPTDSPQVQKWMKELDGWNIPNLDPTVDGDCASSPKQAADAKARGWWTCGGWTRDTDITVCPNKMDWGVSFDDGPSTYTQKLLNYLSSKDILATFFVVGSRCLYNSAVLLEEYMSGHEIAVHTWSHHPLTAMTNDQIVAELGWTREIIKQVTGVTPVTMRAPFGDIDDRVRAISLAMGMVPIQWTRTPQAGPFDTNDWKVAAGQVSAPLQLEIFESILGNATTMDTGFVVLQHDLYEQAVDLAVGYTLDKALKHQPPFNLKPIGTCQGWPASNLYLQTTTNTTFPYKNSTAVANKGAQAESDSGSGASALGVSVAALFGAVILAVSMF